MKLVNFGVIDEACKFTCIITMCCRYTLFNGTVIRVMIGYLLYQLDPNRIGLYKRKILYFFNQTCINDNSLHIYIYIYIYI